MEIVWRWVCPRTVAGWASWRAIQFAPRPISKSHGGSNAPAWIEGCIEGVTGWAIGANHRGLTAEDERAQDAAALYDKLEQVVLPLFYGDQQGFINVMRHAIALNGSFFNTQRMMQQYMVKAYFL